MYNTETNLYTENIKTEVRIDFFSWWTRSQQNLWPPHAPRPLPGTRRMHGQKIKYSSFKLFLSIRNHKRNILIRIHLASLATVVHPEVPVGVFEKFPTESCCDKLSNARLPVDHARHRFSEEKRTNEVPLLDVRANASLQIEQNIHSHL